MTKKFTKKESKYLTKQVEKMQQSKDKDDEVLFTHEIKVALSLVGY